MLQNQHTRSPIQAYTHYKHASQSAIAVRIISDQVHVGSFVQEAQRKRTGVRGLPWVALSVGWHPKAAPPGFDCSGKSHRGLFARSSAACPPTRRGGCSATREYTSACPASERERLPVKLRRSASEKRGDEVEQRWGRRDGVACKRPTLDQKGCKDPKYRPSETTQYPIKMSYNG